MKTITCETVQRTIWTSGVDASGQSHLETCDACRLEVRRAGQLSAAFLSIRDELADPPPHLHASIVAAIPEPLASRVRRLVVHPGTIGAMGACAAAVVGVLLARRRLGRLSLPARPALRASQSLAG